MATPNDNTPRRPEESEPRRAPQSASKGSPNELSEQEYVTSVATPNLVRTVGSLLFGGAVGAMGLDISPQWKIVALVVLAGAALLFVYSHPYRREVRAAYESRQTEYRTTAARVLPLFPDWLALMILPALPIQGNMLAVIAFVIASGYNYLVFPWIDGTSYTQQPDSV